MHNIDKYDIQYISFIPEKEIGNETIIKIYYHNKIIDNLLVNNCAACAMVTFKWWLLQEVKN